PIDHPEILLPALIIVATKLLFPFQRSQLSSLDLEGVPALKLDWAKWAQSQGDLEDGSVSHSRKTKPSFQDMNADKIVSMPAEELDSYFKRILTLVDNRSKTPCAKPTW